MADKDSELRVVRQSSDGRRRYNEDGKRALVEAALRRRVGGPHGAIAPDQRQPAAQVDQKIPDGARERRLPTLQNNDDDLRPSGDAPDTLATDPPSSH